MSRNFETSTPAASPFIDSKPTHTRSMSGSGRGDGIVQDTESVGDSVPLQGRKEKGDYNLLVDDEQAARGKQSFGIAGSTAGGGQLIEQVVSHPALPVACYCVASIIMTVVNKVRGLA